MRDRKPYDAKRLQLYYNMVHLAINVYLFHEACMPWLNYYSFRCQSVDFSTKELPMRVSHSGNALILKIFQFALDRRSPEAAGFTT